ncbi:hypothetical protein [Chroococcidiopsis sp.]|uniref:hypothetical protein n=1 Tax=Chroococcidiopsis sp. TaxID=3088168 RepID=UPI003F3BC0C8
MKQLPEALRDRFESLFQLLVGKIIIFRQKSTSKTEIDREETATEPTTPVHHPSKLGTAKKILFKSRQLEFHA